MITQLETMKELCFISTLYKFGSQSDQFYMAMIGNINLSQKPRLIEFDNESRISYGFAGNIVFNAEFQDIRSLRFAYKLIHDTAKTGFTQTYKLCK